MAKLKKAGLKAPVEIKPYRTDFHTIGRTFKDMFVVKIEDLLRLPGQKELRDKIKSKSEKMRINASELKDFNQGKNVTGQNAESLYEITKQLHGDATGIFRALGKQPPITRILDTCSIPLMFKWERWNVIFEEQHPRGKIPGHMQTPIMQWALLAMDTNSVIRVENPLTSPPHKQQPIIHWEAHSDMMKEFNQFYPAVRQNFGKLIPHVPQFFGQ
jgi:hypothetical protein